jgi:hypothetical protein
MEVQDWFLADIRYWHTEAVKLHNSLNKPKDG